jgi:hypothetical protein
MNSRITRLTSDFRREGLTWEERWEGVDRGLVASWERGQDMQRESPEKAVKHKYGSLLYLAMWQGLRGDNLDVDMDRETKVTCTKTKSVVTFTAAQDKVAEA